MAMAQMKAGFIGEYLPQGERKTARAPSLFRKITAAFMALGLAVVPVFQASAQQISLIRDAETEALLADYTAPIFRAANLSSHNIKVHLISDNSFNAFVINGQNMFINTGAIMLSETPNMLIGVIAHETGHIKGGHNAKLQQLMEKYQTAALLLQVLSVAAMAGSAVAGSSEGTQGGAAMMLGGQQVLLRNFLSYIRQQESAADRAAVEFLDSSHQSPAGMLRTFRYFAEQSVGSVRPDPYVLTHPMPAERIAQLQEIAQKSPYFNQKDSPQLQLRHDLVRAKIAAYSYQNNPQRIARQYSDNGLPSRYARAIAAFHTGGYQAAAPALDGLIAAMPQNPWFYELKGTFLLESGNAKDAVAPLRKAVSLVPRSGYIRLELAQAILESGGGSPEEALQMLRVALVDEDQSYLGYRLQSEAYGKLNRIPEANMSAALASFHQGCVRNAKMLAERAKLGLAAGSPSWLKADDILNFRMEKPKC
jgi:predicted Zn-dependent protease